MTDVLCIAAWMGLVTGLLEGVSFLVFQYVGWLDWHRAFVPVVSEIIWVAAFFDLILFGVLGIGLAALARWQTRVPMVRVTFAICALLALYDWLALSGHFFRYGVLSLALGLTVVLTRWFRQHEASALRFMRWSLPGVVAVPVLALGVIQGARWLQERAATAQLPAAAQRAPNILVIVVDTLRADHLSTYGYGRPTSPNLDRLAQQGVVFENAFSTSSWTLPSHASLVTGCYPFEHGARKGPLDDRYPTIAEALRARGYRTGAFSANVSYFDRSHGFGRGFIHFEDYFRSLRDMAIRTLYGREATKYIVPYLTIEDVGRRHVPEINSAVLRWIDRDRDKPFFAFLNYFDTHDPYLPPQPYRNAFTSVKNPGGILIPQVDTNSPLTLTPEELQGVIDAYDGAILYTDHHIAQFLSELQQRRRLENTVIFITSDHGESLGEHGLFGHQNALYRELIRVPLIVVRPGQVPAGVRVTQPVSNAALPATVMEFVGAGDSDPVAFPQQSLSRLWNKADVPSDWPLPISELAKFPVVPRQRPSHHGATKSIVSSDWHCTVHDKFGIELYDWKNDPGELHNLAQNPELQDVVNQLGSQLSSLASHERAPGNRMSLLPVRGENVAGLPGGS